MIYSIFANLLQYCIRQYGFTIRGYRAMKIYNKIRNNCVSWREYSTECYKYFGSKFNNNVCATNILASIIYRGYGYEKIRGYC